MLQCLHDIEYKGQDTKNFIVNVWKFKDIAAFKSNEDVYEFLNSGNKSYGTQVFTVVNVPIHIF